jgi:hypothetical protein
MKVREIITERQQLDELFFIPPAIVALWTATKASLVFRAFMVAFNAWSLVELVTGIIGVIERTGLDIDKMDWQDWAVVVITVVFGKMIVKAGLRTPKDLIDLMPGSTKQQFGNWVKTTFEGKVKEEIAKKAATTAATKPAASTAPKNPNLVDKPFSKDAPTALSQAERDAHRAAGGTFDTQTGQKIPLSKPRNPNLVDRPFSK